LKSFREKILNKRVGDGGKRGQGSEKKPHAPIKRESLPKARSKSFVRVPGIKNRLKSGWVDIIFIIRHINHP
jgi:hypothetical protein